MMMNDDDRTVGSVIPLNLFETCVFSFSSSPPFSSRSVVGRFFFEPISGTISSIFFGLPSLCLTVDFSFSVFLVVSFSPYN